LPRRDLVTQNKINDSISIKYNGFNIELLNINELNNPSNKDFKLNSNLIKLTNFDKEKPEYHSYCVTALNDKHASMIDTNTQTVVKTEKIELFDTILSNNINK
jgi:hypothetical protein